MKYTNKKIITISLQGKVDPPDATEPITGCNGKRMMLPSVGGITYDVKVGDSAFGLAGDHIEPGVSITGEDKNQSLTMMSLACIGNRAKVITGDANGAVGYVTGKHSGINHIIIYFEQDALNKMTHDDKVMIEARGQGLEFEDYPDIFIQSIDPDFLKAIGIEERDGKLVVPVAAVIPPYLMGSGIGNTNPYSGDYDIMTADEDVNKKYGIDKLKLGDLVLLKDCDNTYGRGYLTGAASVGVIIHSDCVLAGHGPGVTTIMSCKEPLLEAKIDANANISAYYKKISNENI